jgi:hypothetical protein
MWHDCRDIKRSAGDVVQGAHHCTQPLNTFADTASVTLHSCVHARMRRCRRSRGLSELQLHGCTPIGSGTRNAAERYEINVGQQLVHASSLEWEVRARTAACCAALPGCRCATGSASSTCRRGVRRTSCPIQLKSFAGTAHFTSSATLCSLTRDLVLHRAHVCLNR